MILSLKIGIIASDKCGETGKKTNLFFIDQNTLAEQLNIP